MAVTGVTTQILTSTTEATYTPTAGMLQVLVICVGGGGGGGSVTAADDTSGGGGGGGCAIELFTAATIGASKLYVAGAGAAAGGTGSTSRLGAVASELIQATGGGPGLATGNNATVGVQAAGGAGGVGTLGKLNIQGQPGRRAVVYSTSAGCGGAGGSSAFGAGGAQSGTDAAGNAGGAYGGGGGGCHTSADVDRTGGAGAAGVLYMIEFNGT